jgi:hypothetical protein
LQRVLPAGLGRFDHLPIRSRLAPGATARIRAGSHRAKEALGSSRNILVAINCEPAAMPILRNRRARSPTSWIPHWPIPVQLGRRRVGSVEGRNAVGCQRPQDRDLGGAVCYVAGLLRADTESTPAIRWLIA